VDVEQGQLQYSFFLCFVWKLKENQRHAVRHHGTKFLGRNNDGTHKILRMAWTIVSTETMLYIWVH